MAVVNSYLSLNTVNPSVWHGQVYEASDSRFVVSDGYFATVFKGYNFQYSADYHLVGGTLTAFSQYAGGQLASENYDFAIPAHLADGYISANQMGDLFSLVLAGDDDVYGSVYADSISGYAGNDLIYGNGGDDYLSGAGGDDVIYLDGGSSIVDGGSGFDWVETPGQGGNYRVERYGGELDLYSGADGVDATLTGVERIGFDNGVLAFDVNGNAGQAYRIYEAAFDREPDLSGLSYWINRMDSGAGVRQVAAEFIHSQEFVRLYGANVSNEAFVARLYENILDRAGESSGYNYWVGQLNSGAKDRATVLADFSESNENKANVYLDDGIWYV